jgi:hypothetical protein
MGISFMVAYVLYVIQVFFVSRYQYQFSFTPAFYKIFILQFGLAVACLVIVKVLGSPFSYIVGSLFIAVSAYFAFKELDKRLDLKSIFSGIKNRF